MKTQDHILPQTLNTMMFKFRYHNNGAFFFKTAAICFLIVFLSLSSCKKFTEVGVPLTTVSNTNVFLSDQTAISFVTSLYSRLSPGSPGQYSILNLSASPIGISSDELTLWAGNTDVNLLAYYQNSLSPTTGNVNSIWNEAYSYIYTCNEAIEGMQNSNTLSPGIKNQLLGESKFFRAYCYFLLVNIYGDVPLVLSTAYNLNSTLPRTPIKDVYQQINSDLQDAKTLLSDSFLSGTLTAKTTERVRPTKGAASLLLARVYLYTNNWSSAETEASSVIANPNFQLTAPSGVFLKNSNEAIWQLQPTASGTNTSLGTIFTTTATGPNSAQPYYLSKSTTSNFEPNDARFTSWIGSVTVSGTTYYYPAKYKQWLNNQSSITSTSAMTEYSMVFRLAEAYLIRSEACAMQGKFQQCIDDINTLRLKHGGLNTPIAAPTTQAGAITVIMRERVSELFAEWGNRWFDLKRTGLIDGVMSQASVLKGSSWSSYKQLFPIPSGELQADYNLVQNLGY